MPARALPFAVSLPQHARMTWRALARALGARLAGGQRHGNLRGLDDRILRDIGVIRTFDRFGREFLVRGPDA